MVHTRNRRLLNNLPTQDDSLPSSAGAGRAGDCVISGTRSSRPDRSARNVAQPAVQATAHLGKLQLFLADSASLHTAVQAQHDEEINAKPPRRIICS